MGCSEVAIKYFSSTLVLGADGVKRVRISSVGELEGRKMRAQHKSDDRRITITDQPFGSPRVRLDFRGLSCHLVELVVELAQLGDLQAQ